MVTDGNRRALAGVLFLASVDASYNAYSALNSSPQTTELFAAEREQTLMKYVWIGNGAALFLGGFSSMIARSWWPLGGTVFVMAQMHWLYKHAAACGKKKAGKADTSSTSSSEVVGSWRA